MTATDADNLADNNLPDGWVWVKMGEVANDIHYGFTATTVERNTGVKILRITDIQEGKVEWNEVPFVEVNNSDLEKYRLKIGDIVFARSGNTVGKTFLIETPIPVSVFASYLIRVVLSDTSVSKKFVFLFFQSNEYWKQIREGQAGIGQPNFNGKKLSELNLPLPPLPEQHRIVAKLERLFARLARAEEHLRQSEAALERYRQSVLKTAFTATDAEGKMKDGWKCVKLGEVGTVVRGASPRPAGDPKYFGGEIPWITVGEITKDDEMFLTSVQTYVTEAGKERSRYIEPDTLLLTNSGATLGVPKITKIGGCINDGSVAILNLSEEMKRYFYFFLKSKTKELRQINQGAAQPNLNTSIVKEIDIPLPPLEKIEAVSFQIETALTRATALHTAIVQARAECARLRQSILREAFAGRLVPQQAGDEPAGELLERIKREREKAGKPNRNKKA